VLGSQTREARNEAATALLLVRLRGSGASARKLFLLIGTSPNVAAIDAAGQ
jgi:hypothetical protein